MKYSIILKLIISIYLISGYRAAYSSNFILPNKVDVVTSNKKPLNNTEYAKSVLSPVGSKLNIYNLDSIAEFKLKLNKQLNLPADEVKAKVIVYEYINKIGQEDFNKQVISVYQGLLTTFKYKLDRYPAIIFDNSSVIYGVSDLKHALKKYHDWQYKKLSRKGRDHE